MPSYRFRTGSTGDLRATGLTGLNAINGITVAFWARPAQVGGLANGDVFRHSSTANANRDGYRIGFDGGLGIRVCGAAGSADTYFPAAAAGPRRGRWSHWCLTFDDASNAVRAYRDGHMVGVGTNATDMTSNASCTTVLPDASAIGRFAGDLFDVQVLPEFVASIADVRELMSPTALHYAVRARWCGLAFRETAIGATVFDQSGNGNHLVATTEVARQYDEPPFRPTYT